MAVNRFVLNGISYHGHGAINEIPGLTHQEDTRKLLLHLTLIL